MRRSADSGPRHWSRTLTAFAITAVVCSLLVPVRGAIAGAQTADSGPDAAVYLQQLQPVLADAQSNLRDLQYYLPIASVSDPTDPTWGLAQQASDAVAGDADLMETLSPPDALSPLNDALIAALRAASATAGAAIDALSGGDTVRGDAQLAAFRDILGALSQAEAGLPAGVIQGSGTSAP